MEIPDMDEMYASRDESSSDEHPSLEEDAVHAQLYVDLPHMCVVFQGYDVCIREVCTETTYLGIQLK